MFESIVEAVASHAAQNPDKLCVADKDGSYTYGEVWDREGQPHRVWKGLE